MPDQHDEEMVAIGRAVKDARTGKGWSLRHLAERAGVSASLISGVENARIVPTIGSLFAISDALGVPAGIFLPERHAVSRLAQPGSGDSPADPSTETETAPDRPVVPGPESTEAQRATPNEALPSSEPPVTSSLSVPAPARAAKARIRRSVPRRRGGPMASDGLDAASSQLAARAQEVAPVLDPGGTQRREEVVPRIDGIETGIPGVHIFEPVTMRLNTGTIWRLLAEDQETGSRLIDVDPGPPGQPDPPFVIAMSPLTVHVRTGRLIVEVAFKQHVMVTGATFRIERGVPYRFSSGDQQTAFLILVGRDWSGRI